MPAPTDRSRPTLKLPGRRIAAPELPRGLRETHRGGPGDAADNPFLPRGFVRAVDAVDLSASARDITGGAEQAVPTTVGQVLAVELAQTRRTGPGVGVDCRS